MKQMLARKVAAKTTHQVACWGNATNHVFGSESQNGALWDSPSLQRYVESLEILRGDDTLFERLPFRYVNEELIQNKKF